MTLYGVQEECGNTSQKLWWDAALFCILSLAPNLRLLRQPLLLCWCSCGCDPVGNGILYPVLRHSAWSQKPTLIICRLCPGRGPQRICLGTNQAWAQNWDRKVRARRVCARKRASNVAANFCKRYPETRNSTKSAGLGPNLPRIHLVASNSGLYPKQLNQPSAVQPCNPAILAHSATWSSS